jgi:hypothetical protein
MLSASLQLYFKQWELELGLTCGPVSDERSNTPGRNELVTIHDDTHGLVELLKRQRLQGHDTALSLLDPSRGEMCRGDDGV